MDGLVIFALIWIIAAMLVGAYAQSRGADGMFFALIALVLTPVLVGLYVVAMDPAKHQRRAG